MSRYLNGKYSRLFFPSILVLIFNIPLMAIDVTYYSQGSGSFSTTSNWNTDRGGAGSSPGNIISADIFVIQSTHTITLNTGSNQISGLTVENGGVFDNGSSTLHVTSTSAACSVDVQSGGTYTESTGGIEFSKAVGDTPTFTLQSATSETFNDITLRDGALSLSSSSGTITYTINGTLLVSLNAGAISTSSVNIAYGTSSTLSYGVTSNYSIGAEWTGSLDAANVILNMSGNTLSGGGTSRTVRHNLGLTDGTVDLGSSTVLTVLGDITGSTVTGGGSIGSNTTLRIGNGSGSVFAQSVSGNVNLNKFEVNKTGGSGGSEGAANTLTCSGQLIFSASGTLTVTAGTMAFSSAGRLEAANLGTLTMTISSGGVVKTGGQDLTAVGTISAGSGKIVYNYATGSENLVTNTNATVGTLEINNASGVQASAGTLTVGTELILTNGLVTSTSSNILLTGAGATISGASTSSFVAGPLQRTINSTAAYPFPVGVSGNYRPAVLDYDDGASPSGTVQMEYRATDPGGTPPAGISSVSTGGHYRMSGNTTGDYQLTLRYTDAGFNPESRTKILVQTGAGPTYTLPANQSVDEGNDDVTAPVITTLPTTSPFVLAFGAGGTSLAWTGATGDWNAATNWNPQSIPTSTDDVTIDGGSSIVTVPSGYSAVALSLTMTNSSTLILANVTPGINFGGGSWNSSATTLTSGTVQYDAGTVHEDDYNNLTFNGATTSESGTINVAGNLSKQGSGNITVSADVNVTGNYTNSLGNATYSGGITIEGTLQVDAGTINGSPLTINSTTITVNGGAFAGTAVFSGGSTQTLGGSAGSASFANLTMDNANGLIFNIPVNMSGVLDLSNGLINTQSGLLTLGTGGSISNDNNPSSFIQGPLAKQSNLGPVSFTYPIGKSELRRVIASTNSSNPRTAQWEVFDSAPSQSFDAGIIRISTVRYFLGQLTAGGPLTSTSGNITLQYGADDGVQEFNNGGDVIVAHSTDNGGDSYSDLGGQSSGGAPTGDVTSTGPVPTSLGFFTFGTTTGDNSLPVELSAFSADLNFDRVTLKWKTASELENLGFDLYKRTPAVEEWTRINPEMIPGQGNTSAETDYEFVDRSVAAGQKYEYMLESISVNGLRVSERTIDVTVPVPADYSLDGNYPNPFNPSTRIKFQLPEKAAVTVFIYDIRGNLVNRLAYNQSFDAGEHQLTWNATDDAGRPVSSGMYVYRFTSGVFQKTGKMIFLK